jgi:4,4'-diaponeurosporenoate glycosyltransferase
MILTAFSGSSEKFMGFAGLYLLYVVQIAWMLNRTGRFRLTTSFLYPIPLLFFALVFIRALILSCLPGRLTWKGRTLKS